MKAFVLPLIAVTTMPCSLLAQEIGPGTPIIAPAGAPPAARVGATAVDDYVTNTRNDRTTFVDEKNNRGTTTVVPEDVVIRLCGDKDGCKIRIGLHNWDDTGRVASRETLFYYNRRNRAWRAELSDPAGTNSNNVTEHIINAWACYFTDGRYQNWADLGDKDANFGLLSWNQYNADCFMVIVD